MGKEGEKADSASAAAKARFTPQCSQLRERESTG